MQTTLLGLAIAAILALVAALVGPQFVDWGKYRANFEAEGSRFFGQPVRIRGPIDVRLLPVPTIVVRDVEVGARAAPAFGAQTVRVELALAALMRGEVHASALSLTGPEVSVALDADGRVISHLNNLGLDQIGIDRLAVVDGRLALEDTASRTRTTFDKLNFSGELRSQSGQVKGEGSFTVREQSLRYQLTTGRRDAATRVRLNVESADRPIVFETDGNLTFEKDSPKFEGTVSIARPAGVVLDSGKALAGEPWRISGKVNADTRSALFEQVDAQYGPDDRRMRLGGTAEFRFGAQPRFESVLSARQLDLDRALAASGAGGKLPLTALTGLADMLGSIGRPPVPVSVGVGIDALTLGGATVQSLRADVKSADGIWSVDTFEFRAPGGTQVKLSGRLGGPQGAAEFSGPVAIESVDPAGLLAWLESAPRRDANLGSLKLRSDVTAGATRLVFDRVAAEIDRKTLDGRLAYTFASGAQRAKLDVALNAAEFDVEAAYGMVSTALAGSKIERPGEVALAIDLGKTTLAGVPATSAKANLRYDASGLRIERLAVADFGGAALSASGQIDIAAEQPHGNISLNLTAPKLDGVVAVLDKFYPGKSDLIVRHAARLSPARVEASFSVDPPPASAAAAGGKPASAKISLNGQLGAIKLAITGDGTGTVAAFGKSEMRLNVRANADDGALLTVLGLDAVVPVDRRPSALTVTATGALNGDMRIDAKVTGEGFEAATTGTLKLSEPAWAGALSASLTSADVRGARRAGAAAFPVALRSNVRVAGEVFEFKSLAGKAGAADVKGEVSLTLPNHQMSSMRIDGKFAADTLDVASVLASVLGAPAAVTPQQTAQATQATVWPAQPFAANLFSDLQGRVEFEAARATLPTPVPAQKLRGVLKLSSSELSFENLSATIGGGNISGQASFERGSGGLTLRGRATLASADAATVIRAGVPAPVAGRVAGQVSFESTGTSPAALIAGLRGEGTISLDKGRIAGLDRASIEAATRAFERGAAVTSPRVTDIVARSLDAGSLMLPTAVAPVEISNGRVRLGKPATPDGDVTIGATLDLVEETLDARVVLLGSRAADAQGLRPELTVLYKGPPSAPRRTIDVSALMSWLTLQSVERESKKLEAEERELKRRQALEALINEKLRESSNPVAVTGATSAPQAAMPPHMAAPTTPPVTVSPPAPAANPSSTGLFAPTLPAPQLIQPEPKPAANLAAPAAAAAAPPMPAPIVVPRASPPAAPPPAERAAPTRSTPTVTAAAPPADDLAPTPGALPDNPPLPPRRPSGAVLAPTDLAPAATPEPVLPRRGTILQHNAPQ